MAGAASTGAALKELDVEGWVLVLTRFSGVPTSYGAAVQRRPIANNHGPQVEHIYRWLCSNATPEMKLKHRRRLFSASIGLGFPLIATIVFYRP
jgi:hypothetical protein